MLKTVELSTATKTKGIAVTYRSGSTNMYNTCPISCSLNSSGHGTNTIDKEYLDVLFNYVPRRGYSWTYTHFLIDNKYFNQPNKAVINYSTDNIESAKHHFYYKKPTVTVVNSDYWGSSKYKLENEIKVIRCPAEYLNNFSCRDCGNGQPLCARFNRNYIVGFTGHGARKKIASNPKIKGGCYAGGGNVAIHWRNMVKQKQPISDAVKLKNFIKALPPRSLLRHHIAGDIGLEKNKLAI